MRVGVVLLVIASLILGLYAALKPAPAVFLFASLCVVAAVIWVGQTAVDRLDLIAEQIGRIEKLKLEDE